MSVPAWHVDLPQELLVEGYNGSLPDVTIKSDMDAGPAKVRRRFTAGVSPISGVIIVTTAQLNIFKIFYNSTLLGGSLRFTWTEPPEHTVECEMRFTEIPSYTKISDNVFKIKLSLEILP